MARKLRKENLQVLSPNVIENDLLYVSSVLSHVDNVISKTYGPRAGFVAQVVREKQVGGYTYTKDGMTTLAKLAFNTQADIDVLNMVRILAFQIKNTSGDGSTTGAKILSNIIRFAAEDLYFAKESGNENKYYPHRIRAPKAVEILTKLIKQEITKSAKKVSDYQDIIDAAYISLNNDPELLRPFVEIVNNMKERGVAPSEDLEIQCFHSYGDDTSVDFNPGFALGTHEFIARSKENRLEMAKVIMLSNRLTMDYASFIVSSLIDDAAIYGRQTGLPVLYIVSGLDKECKTLIRKAVKAAAEKEETFYCDFIELDYVFDSTNNKREDLSYFLNIDEINLGEYIEKRRELFKDANGNPIIDGPDNYDTTDLIKWKATQNDKGEVDWFAGARAYQDAYIEQINKGLFCNVKYTPGLGLTITPAKGMNTTPLFKEHLERLKVVAKDPTPEIAESAQRRLYYLRENFYAINVGNRVADGDRIFHAYNDASRAINSMMKDGYHMGGSIGAIGVLTAVEDIISKVEDNDTIDTAKYIVSLLKESFIDIVDELLKEGDTYEEALLSGKIDTEKNKFYNTTVINPVMTDQVIMVTVLYQFASLYSSLLLELDNPDDTMHIRMSTRRVIDGIKGIKEIESTPVAKIEISNADGDSVELTPKSESTPEPTVKESAPVIQEPVQPVTPEIHPITSTPVAPQTPEITPTIEAKPVIEEKVEEPKKMSKESIFELHKKRLMEEVEEDSKRNLVGEFTSRVIDENGNRFNNVTTSDKLKEIMKDYEENYMPKVTESIGVGNGVRIEISRPSNIEQADLDRIKSGAIFSE